MEQLGQQLQVEVGSIQAQVHRRFADACSRQSALPHQSRVEQGIDWPYMLSKETQ